MDAVMWRADVDATVIEEGGVIERSSEDEVDGANERRWLKLWWPSRSVSEPERTWSRSSR